ncbi:hypothetical protein [Marivita sp.]|uniref:hypothetical protein n=1 Tax=Marivita sp. TaxID=2003365 RepID=UPI0025B9AA73|nr:hypothetical protein [Marivita sp.]
MTPQEQRDHILVLEDEVIIAIDLAVSLEEAGYAVMGPYHCAATALAELESGTLPRWAILDVNLGRDQTSEDVARRLTDKNVPILFLTGYEERSSRVLQQFPAAAKMPKPMVFQTICNWLSHHS